MKPDYTNETTELEIVTMAKNGDKNATELLWKKYRKPMMNVFWGILKTSEERESEAAYVFMHYVTNLFDPEKAENQRKDWKFFSYLYSGMVCRRSKLLRERQCLLYDESEDDPESKSLNAEKVCLSNKDLFLTYNPEQALMFKLDWEKSNQLKDHIDRIQKIKAEYFKNILAALPDIQGRKGNRKVSLEDCTKELA
jgi:hypothetical protein